MGEIPKLAPDPMIGKTLGRARIERKLATGGFANVYYAITDAGHREVAIKVLLPGLITDAVSIERFHLEAEAASKIHHPNVVEILNSGQEGDLYYIVMEFAKGEPLEAELRRVKNLPFDRATRICRDLCKALEAAHAVGVVHRDIKPGNVVVDSEGGVKLTDFGIARDVIRPRGLTAPDVMIGTPEFMSPEQVDGGAIDGRSDLYSLGVMYYYLLTGGFPFVGESDVSTAMARLKEKPIPIQELMPEVDPRCVKIINKLLEKEPKKRPQTAREATALFDEAIYQMGETKARVKSGVIAAPKQPPTEREKRTLTASRTGSVPRPPTAKTMTVSLVEPKVSKLAVVLVFAAVCLVLGAGTVWTRGQHGGLPMGLAAGSLVLGGAAIALCRERMKSMTGWTGAGLIFAGLTTCFLAAAAAMPTDGTWKMIVSPAGLITLGFSLLAAVGVASFGRQSRTPWVFVRRLTVVAGLAAIYGGVAGWEKLAGAVGLFKGSMDIAIPLAIALVFGGFFGAYLMPADAETSSAGRTFGAVLVVIAAVAAVLMASAGRVGSIAWAALPGACAGPFREVAARFVADGAAIGIGIGLVCAAMALLLKPITKR